ncbi:orotidine-5'-phosphate decarboxylase [Microvirga mediterraneensis]|uniref:Orotidine 5'-phosphate decarboxylase n=1 Tax=Microvirga mediterraneensis TaxID=2754695 RepID=A0A838BUW7_9HYPH|nr:orotidine-5'-phosphate decarboxylase [Microvirga mediterraneensis]MBA1158693.1 orotidine-5'-phosphate decarboxylase [Microvirga mediterraneensis]
MSLPPNPIPAGDIRDKLIIGLDVPSVEEARAIVARIGDAGTFYKIGYQLAYAGGFEFARELIGQGKKVFLDLKLHDIGNTVEEGVRSVARLGATFLTVHAYPQTMRAAVAGKAGSSLKILAVTVLTSYDNNDLVEAGYAPVTAAELVARRAGQARDLGIDGIVCAATEAERVRAIVGPDRLIVTPGIRPAGADAGDQKRVVTPAQGIRLGADHLVVARPIVKAADPRAVAEAIVRDIADVKA